MNPLKKLASQTAIYGLPTIIGRLLNYLLNPLFAYSFSTTEMGVVTSGYAYVSFLMIFLTYGMETALFRFSQTEENKHKVYTTALISLLFTSTFFILMASIYAPTIANAIKFTGHSEYVVWFAIIIGVDALTAIPFAKLREQNRAKRFALIKTINIVVNIGLNLFFILFCKRISEGPDSFFKPFVNLVYSPAIGVGYIFISNLLASSVALALLSPELSRLKLVFDKVLWKRMIYYAMPLLIAGLAGMVNETLDRVLLIYLLPEKQALSQAGIYGSCYKISIIMTIFIQTFRFAAEPFFFNHAKEKDARNTYAVIMKYFVIICSLIFLGTMVNIQWIKYFAGPAEFRSGIKVVPILLMANLFLGIFFNQSIWYKLTGQTRFGAFLALFGATITVVLNIYLIPRMGYLGCAWATFFCYASMMVASYLLGNKHYPVNYDLKRILSYIILSVALYFISTFIKTTANVIMLLLKNGLLICFIGIAWMVEKNNLKKLQ
ncbi:MAG: oligosaccharide flippase family protein [Bacteroidia bacterium]